MNPQNSQTTPTQTPPTQNPTPQTTPNQTNPPNQPAAQNTAVPAFRQYWIFGAIYIILPPVIGLIILFTGPIYRKQKDGLWKPISSREKITLTILAFIIWGYFILTHV